jgi:hypothetical protein
MDIDIASLVFGFGIGAAATFVIVYRIANKTIQAQRQTIIELCENIRSFQTHVVDPMLKAKKEALTEALSSALLARFRSRN